MCCVYIVLPMYFPIVCIVSRQFFFSLSLRKINLNGITHTHTKSMYTKSLTSLFASFFSRPHASHSANTMNRQNRKAFVILRCSLAAAADAFSATKSPTSHSYLWFSIYKSAHMHSFILSITFNIQKTEPFISLSLYAAALTSTANVRFYAWTFCSCHLIIEYVKINTKAKHFNLFFSPIHRQFLFHFIQCKWQHSSWLGERLEERWIEIINCK